METKINDAIKQAMITKNESALRALRAIKSAIIIFKTSGEYKGVISAEDEIKILQKLSKQRKDSIAIYQTQNRPDLLQKEQEELTVIESFLPQQLDEVQLSAMIQKIQSENNISSIAEMGKLIGLVNKEVAGRADGKTISLLVKNLLS